MQVERLFLEVTQRRVTIELPESFLNHRIELIALTVDEEKTAVSRRSPHPDIAGKGQTLGDLIGSIVNEEDWECLK